MAWLGQIEFWHWWIAGVALALLEVLAPGAFFLWLGIAAGLTGLLLLLIPGMGWEIELLLFAGLAVIVTVAGRAYLRRHPIDTDDSTLNRRAEQYVGRVFTLEQPIANGRGRVKVDDTVWRVAGEDMPAGLPVRVIGVDGAILKVEKAAA